MSRLRKIYKGEENWEILFTDNDKNFLNPEMAYNKENSSTINLNNKKFNEDSKNLNKGNLNSVKELQKPQNTKAIENKLNNFSLNNENPKNLYDIDNDNFFTEEELKEFKFENLENESKINNLKITTQSNKNTKYETKKPIERMEITEDDYDYFYQMEMEEVYGINKNSNNNLEKDQLILKENRLDKEIINLLDVNLGKRTHSEAFRIGIPTNLDTEIEYRESLPMKIRKSEI